MKACLIYAALLGGALATSACLAEERVSKPAHATDSPAANPTEHAGGQEAAAPRGSDSSVHAPPDAAGEHPGVDHPDASVSKALKPDAGKPSPGAARAHGPRQPTANSHNDNARPPNPLDTRITVNQGRALENNRKGLVHKQEAPFDKANRTNAQKGIQVPHSVSRPGVVRVPTRNAVGIAPDTNAAARRIGPTALPSTDSARGPVGAARSSTNVPGVGPLGGAPVVGGTGSGTGATGARGGRPVGIPGSAAINGTGMARGNLRVGEIGGAARNNGGINGTTVRSKRP